MELPFTQEQFVAVFEQYNISVWPVQIFLYILGLTGIILSIRKFKYSDKIIVGILSFLWLWIGIVYHFGFFATINPMATIFGIMNILQGLIFLYFGVIKSQLTFKYQSNIDGIAGAILILYGLIIYPILGYFLGHAYPQSPTFGLPCPTTIFTFGLLLWCKGRIPIVVLVIPFLWSLIGFSAALKLGIHEDIGLLLAGIFSFASIVARNKISIQI